MGAEYQTNMYGKWYAAGYNDEGQLGLGHKDDVRTFTEVAGVWGKIVAVVCGWVHTFMLSEHGKVYVTGYNYFGELGLGHNYVVNSFIEFSFGLGKIIAVECEWDKIFIRLENGKWYTTRGGTFTEFGCNNRNIAKIICGEYYTFILEGKICRKCGCCFTPTKLSNKMLMNINIPELPIDLICYIIRVSKTISAKPNCREGGHCCC